MRALALAAAAFLSPILATAEPWSAGADLRFGVIGTGQAGAFASTFAIVPGSGPFLALEAAQVLIVDGPRSGGLRLVLGQQPRAGFRVAASLSALWQEGLASESGLLGLHATYRGPDQTLGATLNLPDDIETTGAFSFDLTSDHLLSPATHLTARIHRLSTDREVPDHYTIRLGLRTEAAEGVTLLTEGFLSATDTGRLRNRGLRWEMATTRAGGLGLAADLSLYQDASAAPAASIGLRLTLGAERGQTGLPATAPIQDWLADLSIPVD